MKRSLLLLMLLAACDDGGSNPKDAGPKDGGIDSPLDASCFENPQTHEEIINACTDAQKIYKDSHPALMNQDGTLPDLPP